MTIFAKHAMEAFASDPAVGAVRLTRGQVNYDLDENFRKVSAELRRAVEVRKQAAQGQPSNLSGLLGSFLQGLGGHGMYPNGIPVPQGREYASNQGGQLLNQALGGLLGGAEGSAPHATRASSTARGSMMRERFMRGRVRRASPRWLSHGERADVGCHSWATSDGTA